MIASRTGGRLTHGTDLPVRPPEDLVRRAAYERLCRGENVDGSRGRVVMAVWTLNLDEGRGDVYVAAGLGLALIERGYGVQLLARGDWHLADQAEVFVAMLPQVDPSVAPAGAWKVAWVRNETEHWASLDRLKAFDQVVASSEIALRRLARETPRASGVLRIGVDTELFTPPEGGAARVATAVTTAHFWGTERAAHRALMELPDDADVTMYGNARGAPQSLLRWHRRAVPYFALPELYRRCSFVIDDMNATTVGFGTLNSRFFESAACGSLPVVNGLLGLRELDLPDIPRYTDAVSLAGCLRELRQDPGAVRELADQLQRIVREEHSWVHRAEEFEGIIAEGRRSLTTPPPAHAVHFFPDYTSNNPYQSLLQAGLGEVDAYPVAVPHLIGYLRRRVESPGDPGVLSMHWTNPILQWAPGPFRAKLTLDRFKEAIDAFVGAGGRLIWTVHNVLPHDTQHRWAEIEMAQHLADRAHLVHVMSEATLEAVRDVYHLDPAKVVVIEHSSYVGYYPDWVSREAARSRLGIHPEEKVLLALGGIRPYKGLDSLLDVFDDLRRTDPTLRLLIAGKPSESPVVEELRQRCEQNDRVIAQFGHVADDQLQVWMKAADIAVLPYRDILNSGAFLLAQTFGLPVVAPRAGTLRTWEEQPHVTLFDPQDPASISSAVRESLAAVLIDPEGQRAHALEAARSRTPEAMASKFAEAVAPWLERRG